ncbi:MAG: hypothetical protein KME30_12690 [Iphinoe sp. HA4291-MV1]|jgi:hypothetical protein|nr:hypothetical protein [Iphinoe sp. HA4291-MV1]
MYNTIQAFLTQFLEYFILFSTGIFVIAITNGLFQFALFSYPKSLFISSQEQPQPQVEELPEVWEESEQMPLNTSLLISLDSTKHFLGDIQAEKVWLLLPHRSATTPLMGNESNSEH